MMLTSWGYTLMEEIPDLLAFDQYDTYTGGQYSGFRDRIEAVISAASLAIRNYVGWHLGPSAACKLSTTFLDRRVTRVGTDVLIQLPARHVTEIGSVQLGGAEYEDYVLDPTGLLRVINAGCYERFAKVEVTYKAGLPSAMLAPIEELAAHRITHAIAVPAGITSEASGGVSVTYNAGWINNAMASGFSAYDKELLAPYKVEGVF